MKRFEIYCHTNKINGKSYIGFTSLSMQERWETGHCSEANKNSKCLIHKAIRKYGSSDDVWTHELLDVLTTVEGAKHAEKLWIAQRKTNAFRESHHGYNMTDGGDGAVGTKASEETLEKLSISHRGEKNSMFGRKGKDHPMFGKVGPWKDKIPPFKGRHHSDDSKKLLSEARLGKKTTRSPEECSESVRKSNETRRKEGTLSGYKCCCKKCGNFGHFAKTCKEVLC